MKEDVIQRLSLVLNALNNISVSGKPNLTNLTGSISIIEELYEILDKSDITMPQSIETD